MYKVDHFSGLSTKQVKSLEFLNQIHVPDQTLDISKPTKVSQKSSNSRSNLGGNLRPFLSEIAC